MADTDTHNSIMLLSQDGTGEEYSGGGSGGFNKTIKAMYDESTALYSHSAGDIVYVDGIFYKVTDNISVGDEITVGTNITSNNGIPDDYPVYVENLPGESDAQDTIIAPVERGTTASRAYSVGEMFIRDGAYCTCIVAIESGGAFVLNTNYKAGTVADVIAELRDDLGVETTDISYTGAIQENLSVLLDNSHNYNNALSITLLQQMNSSDHYSGIIYVTSDGALYFHPLVSRSATAIRVRSLWRKNS